MRGHCHKHLEACIEDGCTWYCAISRIVIARNIVVRQIGEEDMKFRHLITDEMQICCTTQTLVPLVIWEHTPVTLTATNISRENNTKYIYYWLNHRERYMKTLMYVKYEINSFNFLKNTHTFKMNGHYLRWEAPASPSERMF